MYHICETSSFENAPAISPQDFAYYVDSGNLDLTATYDLDEISATTSVLCGPFTLVTEFDSAEQGSDLDAGTTIEATDATQITFSST